MMNEALIAAVATAGAVFISTLVAVVTYKALYGGHRERTKRPGNTEVHVQ